MDMKKSERHKQCVILLHGLARTRNSMRRMENELKKQGFCAVNVNYPSRKLPIAELASLAIDSGINESLKKGAESIHFVTHSLGGILVRQFTQDHQIDRLKRVVMLGPPNQGSEAVDRLKKIPGYKLMNGPAGSELGTSDEDLPFNLGPVNFELGVIAGTRSVNPFLSTLIPGKDDGKVAVEKTKIGGMKDFIELPVSHTFMMRNSKTIRQTIYFLEHGEFDHATE
jgi:hypothetical protein